MAEVEGRPARGGSLLSSLRVLVIGSDPASDSLADHLLDLGASVSYGILPEVEENEFETLNFDVVVTSLRSSEIDQRGWRPALEAFVGEGIWLSLTPWGFSGPWSDVPGNDLCVYAESGLMNAIGTSTGEPLRLPGTIASSISANAALAALLGGLCYRDAVGVGQFIDVAMVEVMASNHEIATVVFAHLGRERERLGGRLGHSAPWNIFACKDGHVGIIVPEGRWELFVNAVGIPELLDPKFATRSDRVSNVDELEAILSAWTATRTRAEVYAWGQEMMLPFAPVVSFDECLEDEQHEARAFSEVLTDGRRHRVPFPVRFVPSAPVDLAARRTPTRNRTAGLDRREPQRALTGVRVLDFGIAWAGPLAGRMLGDLGADVIKIETARRLDTRGSVKFDPKTAYVAGRAGSEPWNRTAVFVDRHRNKRSLVIEIDSPQGREVVHRLAAASDIVIENFAPRVMPNLGVEFRDLALVNPRLVYVSLSGFGQTGPRRNQVAFGDTIEQACGSTYATGYLGGPPLNSGTHWPDTASGYIAVAAALAAMRKAREFGVGMHVDVSELEVALRAMSSDFLSDGSAEQRHPPRVGNQGFGSALEACFMARDGTYVAVSLSPDQVGKLEQVIPSCDNAEADRLLRDWIAVNDADYVCSRLRDNDIPSGVVRNMHALFSHPQLVGNHFFQDAIFDGDSFRTIGFPARLAGSPMTFTREAPKFGQDNIEILRDVAGFSVEEISVLSELGVISSRPLGA